MFCLNKIDLNDEILLGLLYLEKGCLHKKNFPKIFKKQKQTPFTIWKTGTTILRSKETFRLLYSQNTNYKTSIQFFFCGS